MTLILPCIGMMGGNMPVVCAKKTQPAALYTQFQTAKCDQRVAVYWYWISDNISVEGVERDLEAMKKAGIDRAFIGNIWEGSVRPGGIKVLSPGWWEVLHAALKKATELDIQIGLFNCPGWSQSGGPWIKPQQSMRYLAQQHVRVKGNGMIQSLTLPVVGKDAQDVCVVAVPDVPHKSFVCEVDKEPGVRESKDIHLDEPMTLRSVLFETPAYLLVDATLEAKVNGEYKVLRTEHLDRTNHNPNVGFHPLAPISLSIPDVKAQDFRLTLNGGGQPTKLTVTLSEQLGGTLRREDVGQDVPEPAAYVGLVYVAHTARTAADRTDSTTRESYRPDGKDAG